MRRVWALERSKRSASDGGDEGRRAPFAGTERGEGEGKGKGKGKGVAEMSLARLHGTGDDAIQSDK